MLTPWLPTLVRVYAQTVAMALLFVLAGTTVLRAAAMGRPRHGHAALIAGQAYFVGATCWFVLFVAFSRALGSARRGLGVSLFVLMGTALVGWLREPEAHSRRRAVVEIVAFVLLVMLFSITNIACWLYWNPSGLSPVPDAWRHFGSIHAGRYANYALFIDYRDRVPFLAQDMGQSMLAAVHLLLGVHAPLAALMAWVPVSLAALALLVFGALEAGQLDRAWCGAGTFFVLFCNVALSSRHVMVFDNGSPIALIGYTDLILGVGTFLVFVGWLEQLGMGEVAPMGVFLPGLLGVGWCWCAPQNIVLAIGATGGALWARRSSGTPTPDRAPRHAAVAAVIFVAAIGAGAVQLGPLLPGAWRENVGMPTFVPVSGVALRPYIQYLTSHWSGREWNIPVPPGHDPVSEPRVYESLREETAGEGPWAVAGAVGALVTRHLAASLRAYFFPVSALVLLALSVRSSRVVGTLSSAVALCRFWIALATFGTGFAIVFLLEYGGAKWWLTRFLVPGIAVCLLWGFAGLAVTLRRRSPRVQLTVVAVILVAAVYGPLTEVGWVVRENFVRMRGSDPLSRRLAILASSRGPFDQEPGDVLLALGRPEEAVGAYREHLRRSFQDAGVYRRLAVAQLGLGRREDAAVSAVASLLLGNVGPELGTLLVELYGDVPCGDAPALSRVDTSYSLNLDCPIVRRHVCAAASGILKAAEEAQQPAGVAWSRGILLEHRCEVPPVGH